MIDNSKTLHVLVFYPGQLPVVEETWNDLESLQDIVGGFIEVVNLDDDLLLVCDEEGKIKGYPPNRRVGNDVICGTFFICRSEGPEFSSVTDEDIKKFCRF